MKAKTLRPFLLVLLFGFLSAGGWMILGGGVHHTSAPALTGASPPAGAGAHGATAGPVRPVRPASNMPSSAGLYAQSPASSTPPSAGMAPYGAWGDPASAAHPPGKPGAEAPILIAADDTYDPGAGFGDLGIAGALPAADASNPRGGGRSDSGAGSGSGSPGSGDNGRSGGSGGSSDSGTSSLLDPPGATGGGSSAGGDPADSNSNHQVTAPEPSTLALFLAGTAALGCALRRRRLGS